MTQALVNGLLVGATYALLAVGYALVFGVMRLLTLAHGEVFMAAGLLALIAWQHTPLWVAGLVAIGSGAALSALTDLVSFRPVGYSRPIAAAVSTIGVAIVIENAVKQIRGSETVVAVPNVLPQTDFQLGPLLISSVQLATLLIALVVMLITHL
jgi:branched-chain amino acid transport system permease protein